MILFYANSNCLLQEPSNGNHMCRRLVSENTNQMYPMYVYSSISSHHHKKQYLVSTSFALTFTTYCYVLQFNGCRQPVHVVCVVWMPSWYGCPVAGVC